MAARPPITRPHTRPIAATVLAAGRGLRLGGRAKSSLLIDGHSVLERLVHALRESGAVEVSVVVAWGSETLLPCIERCGARAVPHVRADADLVDSQRMAVQTHRTRHPGHDLLILPADLPLLQAPHVQSLTHAWAARPAEIWAQVPVVEGTRGHPVRLAWEAVQAIHDAPGRPGVREWLRAHPERVHLLPRPEPAHVFDLDTEDDVARLRARIAPSEVRWP